MKATHPIAIVLLLILALSSCTPKMKFVTSSVVPTATGEVSVKNDKNKNYAIDVRIVNLAEPGKLSPPKDAYIVWMESTESSTKKLGRITTATGLLSKALKANLSTTATAKPTRVYITAETNPDVQYPDGIIVLDTRP